MEKRVHVVVRETAQAGISGARLDLESPLPPLSIHRVNTEQSLVLAKAVVSGRSIRGCGNPF